MDHTGYAHLLEAKISFFSLFAGSYFITVVLGLCIAIPLYREEIREEENLIKKPLVFLSCAYMNRLPHINRAGMKDIPSQHI